MSFGFVLAYKNLDNSLPVLDSMNAKKTWGEVMQLHEWMRLLPLDPCWWIFFHLWNSNLGDDSMAQVQITIIIIYQTATEPQKLRREWHFSNFTQRVKMVGVLPLQRFWKGKRPLFCIHFLRKPLQTLIPRRQRFQERELKFSKSSFDSSEMSNE